MVWFLVGIGVAWVMYIGVLLWMDRKYASDASEEIRKINQDTERMDHEMKAYLKRLDQHHDWWA